MLHKTERMYDWRCIVNRISRREFIKALSVMLGTTFVEQFLYACGWRNDSMIATQTRGLIPPSPQTITQTGAKTGAIKQDSTPDLVVARNGEPEELVRRALAALGGMERFVPQGAYVIIKPNICVAYHTYEYAATTNPWVVGELVRQCLTAGASKVQVMDYPFGGTPEAAYVKSGIAEQVTGAGGEMTVMPLIKFVPTEIPDGKDLKKVNIYDDILKADVLINVPIAKHHGSTRLTLSMKNFLGVITSRSIMHRNLTQRIADLNSRINTSLTVVDAIRILMDNGPTGGNLDDVKKLDTVIMSPDRVAADSYATTLFGLHPEDIGYIQAASAMGLGCNDLRNLRIEEINLGA
jgi:uncharacterized protein (DUF362 family)